jgi:hypothetical protein
MKLPRRQFLHLAAGAAAYPAVIGNGERSWKIARDRADRLAGN